MTVTQRLPILPLPYPHVLLPGARISLPISKGLARPLIDALSDGDAAMVGAVPTVPHESTEDLVLHGNDDHGVDGRWGECGCTAKVLRVVRPALGQSQQHYLTIEGRQRFRLSPHHSASTPLSEHTITILSSSPSPTAQTTAAFRTVTLKLLNLDDQTNVERKRDLSTLILAPAKASLRSQLSRLVKEADSEHLPIVADLVVGHIGGEFADRVEYLGCAAGEDRLIKATEIVTKKVSLVEINTSLTQSVAEDVTKQQKEYILRQQLNAIQRELNKLQPTASKDDEFDDQGDEQTELSDLKIKISALVKSSEERKVAVREYRRLKRIPPGSVETSVVRNYLEWLVSLPWPTSNDTPSVLNASFLEKARATLEADHYGLEKVKKRLIEHLAVLRLKQLAAAKEDEEAKRMLDGGAYEEEKVMASKDSKVEVPATTSGPSKPRRVMNKGPILLLYGPPGVGKTSIAQSLARALDRPFQRISLGGVRDEAEIRGHRRTYVASGPGNIVQALRKAGRLDPVILLDEIDKVSHSNFQGDPAAALLEVLDPEQNWSFLDHYINVPIDLSQVLFVATANTLDTISAPLLDRCEILRLPGYTHTEKLRIAKTYLLPKQLTANGMDAERCSVDDEVLKTVIRGWTREAGVRGLERLVGSVVRAKAVEYSERPTSYDPHVKPAELESILGPETFDGEEKDKLARRGIVYGLVVMGEGEGGILPVETAVLPGTGQLRLSGSLGDVIKESAGLALSWVKSHAYALGLTLTPDADPMKTPHSIDIHLHLPAGAQKKDGPSAGVAMICAFVSLLSGLAVPPTIAMTGEITLRGAVTPVGGVKEKILGAHRAGVRKVLLPKRNRKDVEEVEPEVKRDIEFVFVERVEEALAAAFADGEGERRDLVSLWAKDMHVESRL